MKIVLDAMGSDSFPEPEIQAAVQASKTFPEKIYLVGYKDTLEPILSKYDYPKEKLLVVHAPDIVEMTDKPVESGQRKPQNSMAVGIQLIRQGEADAFVTAGNTGAAMFNALKLLGRIRGVQRPALPAVFPTLKGRCIVLDIGANVDCRPEFLVQFARLGTAYAQVLFGLEKPRVGLLSNGEEAGKGNLLVKETYPLLSESGLNFIGNVEGKEVFAGEADVVVTDGFIGNVLVKGSEAVAKLITDTLKQELSASFITKIGALLARPAFVKIKQLVDPGEVGAAPLLGIDGLVFVGHGRSDARAMFSAVRQARKMVEINLMDGLRKAME